MAYRDFTLLKLEKDFGIKAAYQTLFEKPILPIEPSDLLKAELLDAQTLPLVTEKAKSEHIISPVLREVRRNNLANFTLFSGYKFDIDKAKGLNGYCDFLFSKTTIPFEVRVPVFCIVEAKNEIIENGLGQCGAEMLAAKIFNQQDNQPINAIYGCVSIAYDWVFLKLENNILVIDTDRYRLNNLSELLGVFQKIVELL